MTITQPCPNVFEKQNITVVSWSLINIDWTYAAANIITCSSRFNQVYKVIPDSTQIIICHLSITLPTVVNAYNINFIRIDETHQSNIIIYLHIMNKMKDIREYLFSAQIKTSTLQYKYISACFITGYNWISCICRQRYMKKPDASHNLDYTTACIYSWNEKPNDGHKGSNTKDHSLVAVRYMHCSKAHWPEKEKVINSDPCYYSYNKPWNMWVIDSHV